MQAGQDADAIIIKMLSAVLMLVIRMVTGAKGSLKNNFTFYTPIHLLRLRCESSEYKDIPSSSRLAERASQRLKL